MFSIDADGYLHLQGSLNYEGTRNYSVVARGWDGGSIGAGTYADRTISIAVSDVAESPTIGYTPNPGMNRYAPFIGTVSGVDPDGGGVTFELIESWVWVDGYDEELGSGHHWSDWWDAQVSFNSAGQALFPGFPYESYGDGWYRHEVYSDHGYFVARVRDGSGLVSAQITVNFNFTSSYVAPVVLDLDGDGVELTSARESAVLFAMDANAQTVRTGWIGADDAFLALDRDGDGAITKGAEISFTQDLEHATSDLEGLSAFDTNGNLSLDAGDERFAEFRVWQDRNQDGVSQQDELRSLSDAGIESLSLLRTLTGDPENQDGNQISATTDFVRVDGSRGQAADVTLEYVTLESEVVEVVPVDSGVSSDGEDIGDVDRGSDALPAVVRDLPRRRTLPSDPVTGEPVSTGPIERHRLDERRGEREGARPRPWRVADMKFDEPRVTTDEWSPEPANSAPAALHASLSSLSRRRLQMIDAMAGFEPEGSVDLALRPQRHVDSRTLELLTTVARTGSMG